VPPLRWLVPIAVVASTALTYLPALHGQFVTWDDDVNFLENPSYRGLGASELRWMFTTFQLGPYQPLSWLTLGFDYVLWGMDPFGYHLTNVLIHVLNAWLVYRLAVRLFGDRPGTPDPPAPSAVRIAAGAAALWFAIHPLRVESVAWVTERREVLAGSFAILTLLAYLAMTGAKQRGQPATRWLAISIGLFALSLLSKASAMTLPAVLFLLDLWVLRRTDQDSRTPAPLSIRTLLIEKVPFAALGVVAAVIAVIGQRTAKALVGIDRQDPLQLVARSLYALVFYMAKSIAPVDLSNLYEVPFRDHPFDAHYLLSAIAVAAITAIAWRLRRRWPDLLAAWLSYAILLFPVSGIAHGGGQIIADRYTYLPCLSLTLLASGALLSRWPARAGEIGRARTAFVVAASGSVVVALEILTAGQIRVWHDSIALWGHALTVHPLEELRRAGPAHSAEVREYEQRLRAIGHQSVHWAICYNLGTTLRAQGRFTEAADVFAHGVEVSPDSADLRSGWAAVLVDLHRYDEAAQQIDATLKIDPNSASAYFARGVLRVAQGRREDALAAFQRSIAIDATSADAHYNLGVVFADLGRLEDAARSYRRAIAIRPDYAEAFLNLGIARGGQGRTPEAVEALRRALAIRRDYAEAYLNLGVALEHQGHLREAVEATRHALAINPALPNAERNLAALRSELPKEGDGSD